jgi:hypothetical protein
LSAPEPPPKAHDIIAQREDWKVGNCAMWEDEKVGTWEGGTATDRRRAGRHQGRPDAADEGRKAGRQEDRKVVQNRAQLERTELELDQN